ncbi:MAG: urease accessory protein UreD [Nitrosomonadales bacterium]|nr:urease accessory protein UreD [Nitrosomonadales bacterium]
MQMAGNTCLQEEWKATLKLRFARSNSNETILAQRQHSGPLVVQKPLYPEGRGICHVIVLHPPGGVAGGDQLKVSVDVGSDAHALLTTPGAGKWYKANGREAAQHLEFRINENAVLEWLPQESIVYDAAQVTWNAKVELAESACYAGWEITCLGRQACGEQFRAGQLRQNLQIYRSSKLIWGERANLKGGDKLLASPAGLRGCPVSATFVVAAGGTPSPVLENCRTLLPPDDGYVGVSALPEIFIARYLGHSAQAARHYFEALWAVLRPSYANVAAQRPRIWNT